jgi:hypothetical protein
MNRHLRLWCVRFAVVLALHATTVRAHSASDAYLTLTVGKDHSHPGMVLSGEWDVALRDLDFVLRLDDDGDGKLTWGEVRRHQAAIERYAFGTLHFEGAAGSGCAVKPVRQMIDEHADGAYVALFFELVCARAPARLTLSYDLFFAIDPSHRAIFLMHNGADIATAVLSPGNAKIAVTL